MSNKPDCMKCVFKMRVPGDCHIQCTNEIAKVTANPAGVRMGWFCYPFNFDPTWLVTCDGFKEANK
jgi:hypothetical protein